MTAPTPNAKTEINGNACQPPEINLCRNDTEDLMQALSFILNGSS